MVEIPSPRSQGYVGPLIKGEVGDVIRVHFRNLVDVPVSVHPHGVRYDKRNEGEWTNVTKASGRFSLNIRIIFIPRNQQQVQKQQHIMSRKNETKKKRHINHWRSIHCAGYARAK